MASTGPEQTEGGAEPAPKPGFPWLDLLGRAGAISAIVAAWLTLAGWSYAYHYFAQFGIGLSALAIDLSSMPVWGAVSAYSLKGYVLAGAAAFFVSLLIAGSRRLLPAFQAVLLCLIVAAIFVAAIAVGRKKAETDIAFFRSADWPGFTSARVYLDPEALGTDDDFPQLAEDLRDGCYRMIYSDQSHLFLFRPIAGRPNLGLSTTIIARGDIRLLRLGPTGMPLCRH